VAIFILYPLIPQQDITSVVKSPLQFQQIERRLKFLRVIEKSLQGFFTVILNPYGERVSYQQFALSQRNLSAGPLRHEASRQEFLDSQNSLGITDGKEVLNQTSCFLPDHTSRWNSPIVQAGDQEDYGLKFFSQEE